MMRRIFAGLLVGLLLCTVVLALPSGAAELPEINYSDHFYVYNLDNDMVLCERGASERIAPGPTVKLMTALIAIETYNNDLNHEFTVTRTMLSGSYGTAIGLKADEVVTAEQLLHALIVGCANDAASVLATAIAGDFESFVNRMNLRAEELGATHTHYTNPTGLDNPEMYTTVEDIAVIARHLEQYSLFTEMSAKATYIMPKTNLSDERKINNRNYLISTAIEYKYYSPTVTGMIAGNTPNAGYCVVATSTYGNSEYLCIVMGSTKDDEEYRNYTTARDLLNWAYSSYGYINVLSESAIITEIPVNLSAGLDHVTLMPEQGITLFLPTDIDVNTEIQRTWKLDGDALNAPVSVGQKAGTLSLIYRGREVAQVPLVTKSSVERSGWLYFLSLLRAVLNPAWIIPTAVVVAVILLLFFTIRARTRR